MLWRRIGAVAAAACLCAVLDAPPAESAQRIAKQRDGRLLIAGRSLRCGTARNILDPWLPNLGLAAPGVVIFNPRQLNRWPDTVRLFVFHHECGHHHVGGDELAADCWAVKEGVREGWLDKSSLGQVCRSFGNGPATYTHPAGATRCAALNRCFRTAMAAKAKKASTTKAEAAPPKAAAPKLIEGPVLRRSGMNPSPESE